MQSIRPILHFCALLLLPCSAVVLAEKPARDCIQAQQIIAGTGEVAELVQHEDYETFVESKAIAAPLTVQQYFSNPAEGAGGMARVLSCKMKTAQSLNMGAGAKIARGDTSCQAVHRRWLEELWAEIPEGQRALTADQLQVDDEELTFMGPMWLRGWPYPSLVRGEDGKLHLRSRALYVPHRWWIPVPARFMGTYYCHLVAPEYLEALLRGEVEPDV